MKLLTLLSFVAAAASVALAAPVDDSSASATALPQLRGALDIKYFEFDFWFTEYCKDGTNNGRAHIVMSDWSVGFDVPKLPKDEWIEVSPMASPRFLAVSFDAQNSWVLFNYGNCRWGMGQLTSCALCVVRENWSSGLLNCGGGSTAYRNFRSVCNIDMDSQHGVAEDNHPRGITARQTAPEVSRNATTFGQADAQVADDSPVIQSPKVIKTPTDHDGVYQMSLPFQLQIIEYCKDGTLEAIATYRNGNVGVWNMQLTSNKIHYVDHLVPGFSNLGVGPYDFTKSQIAFVYACNEYRCEWKEANSDKKCGQCRAGAWSRDSLACGTAGEILRVKDLECSFILGYSVP